MEGLWAEVARHRAFLRAKGLLEQHRAVRLELELRRVLGARLALRVDRLAEDDRFAAVRRRLVEHQTDPYAAADELLGEDPGAT